MFRTFGHQQEYVRVVGREHQVYRTLALLQLDRRRFVPLVLLLRPLLLLGLIAQEVDELLRFLFQELLAFSDLRLLPFGRDIGQLRDDRRRPRLDRNHEQVAVANVADVRIVANPSRCRFGAGGARDLHAPVTVDHHDVASLDKNHAASRFVPDSTRRRDIPHFVLG